MDTEVTRYLSSAQVGYTVKPHTNAVFTSEDAARERGVRLSQIVKTMIAQDLSGGIHVAMIPGDKVLKLKKLRQVAGGIKIDLVPASEIEQRFGLTIGSISPTQLLQHTTKLYFDRSVLDEELVDISSGVPDAGVELSSKDLLHLLNATVCDVISTSGK